MTQLARDTGLTAEQRDYLSTVIAQDLVAIGAVRPNDSHLRGI
jgi:hypothetical protein